jgi:hypothetical protein
MRSAASGQRTAGRMFRFSLYVIPYTLCAVSFAAAAPDAFIQDGFGARGPALAGAYTALADDVDGIYWNPAGLGRMQQPEISSMYSPNQLQVHRSFVATAVPIRSWGTWAAGWYHLGSSGIELTNETQPIGFDNFSNDAYYLSWGRKMNSRLTIGATAKNLAFSFASSKLSGWGADVGALVRMPPLKAGVLFQDVLQTHLTGNSLSGGGASEDVPRRVRLGLALTWPEEGFSPESVWSFPVRFNVAVDGVLSTTSEEPPQGFPGVEVWIVEHVAFRAGWIAQVGPTWGAGIKFSRFSFDYALLIDPNLTNQSRFSFGLTF